MLDATLTMESDNRFTGATGIIWLFHVVIPLAMALFALSRAAIARRRAAAARTEWVASAPLEPGRQVVRGRVELDQGQNVALRVDVEQEGREFQNKNQWTHTWREVSRKTTAVPFFVRDPRGRVRVEPDEKTLLVDKLDRTERRSKTSRVRTSELGAGEDVFVVGELHVMGGPAGAAAAYRAGGESLILRPPTGGRMLCSAESLESRFFRAAVSERRAGGAFLLLTLVLALFDAGFHLRNAMGVQETAVVESMKLIKGKNTRCSLALVTESGERFTDGTNSRWCSTLGKNAVVPVVTPHWGGWFAHVGTKPAIHVLAIGLGSCLTLLGVVIYLWRNRPWYEGRVDETGPGRLG